MRTLSDVVLDQTPLTMRPDATVQDACREMRDRRAGSVVVTNEAGRLMGIFTGRDAVCRVLAEGKDPARTTLSDVMTADPETISPDSSSLEALRLMWDGGFRHLPLLKGGRVIGVVSKGDFKGMEHQAHDRERDLWEHMR
jgi:CBS domain-containing protein